MALTKTENAERIVKEIRRIKNHVDRLDEWFDDYIIEELKLELETRELLLIRQRLEKAMEAFGFIMVSTTL